jgi:hypothetical protein
MENKKNMKFKLALATITFILLVAFLIGTKYYDSLVFNDYEKFYKSSIKGEIYSIDIKRRGVQLKIKNDSFAFVFYPYTNEKLNGNHIFDHFAKQGDIIIKTAYSDTLYLYKDSSIYRYTFKKSQK